MPRRLEGVISDNHFGIGSRPSTVRLFKNEIGTERVNKGSVTLNHGVECQHCKSQSPNRVVYHFNFSCCREPTCDVCYTGAVM
jgi:hypothetical protein